MIIPTHSKAIIVIGGSAGSHAPLFQVISALPFDLPAAVFIVIHSGRQLRLLPGLLSGLKSLPAAYAVDKESIVPGRIYVAPPDFHMTLESGRVRLSRGRKVNRHRPAIDPLFRSAAEVYGTDVVGVLLSGVLNCGSSGIAAIKRLGGYVVVQDPEDALFPDMPLNAINGAKVDGVLAASKIAPVLVGLVLPRRVDPRKSRRSCETRLKKRRSKRF